MPKGHVCPEFPIQQSGPLPTVLTQKSLTVWSQKKKQWKVKRVT
jgi:hypothetical protein